MKVSVCIATYRRPERLAALLEDLRQQERLPDQVVIVDNDKYARARPVVDRYRDAGAPFRVDYDIQPERNIAQTRNRTVALARGEWIAFVDDDERAPREWLGQLLDFATANAADGVLGPVEPVVPRHAPAWIRRGRFYDFPRQCSGVEVPLNRLRFGNVLLRGERVRAEPGPFDPAYGLATGEDGDLLVRLARRGAKIIWCNEAVVREPIEARRLSLRWLLTRALAGGQEFARQVVRGRYRPISPLGRARFFAVAGVQALVAAFLTVICLPAGRHYAAGWLIRCAANVGKLSALWGFRHRLYA
jgi:succinoglycan biosynthesis protein ExoM